MTETKTTWSERLTSPLTWHYAVFSVLLMVVIVLGTRFAMDWAETSTRATDALANKQVELRALELQTAPLRGLDDRVIEARDQVKNFYDRRIPASYSQIYTQIGKLEVDSGVRLSRVQYTQGPTSDNLTEISLDAGVTGQYAQIMKFINSLERDKNFFVIRAMALTGQQGGMVNLRLRVSTWLRPEAVPAGLPRTGANPGSTQENTKE